MILSSVNFINFSNSKINQNKNTINTQRFNQLNCDTVQFTGAAKILSDICDKAFVDTLSKELNLDESKTAKLKNTIWNFLRENKAKSMGDIGGDEHFDEQVELQGRITKALSVSEDDDFANEYIADELIRRCDDGEDYIPLGLSGFNRRKYFEDTLCGKLNITEGMQRLDNDMKDDDFYRFAKKMLRQTPEESHEFRLTVEEFLKEHNIKSISKLFDDEDLLNEQAALIEKLQNKFDLNETETFALNIEFLKRSDSICHREYQPIITPYIKDADSVYKLVDDGGYSHKVGDQNFAVLLFKQMIAEAESKNYKNVFEIFDSENNPCQSATFKFIKKSALSEEQKTNLIIDLSQVAKNYEEYAQSIPKTPGKDNFYAFIQTEMIKEKISEEFGIEEFASEFLQNTIRKIYPKHVHGGQNCDVKQVAFEIADKYSLPAGAEKNIEKIIKEIFDGGTKTSDEYIIGRITSEME